jgi:uncharacterized protein (TIGR03435 family)
MTFRDSGGASTGFRGKLADSDAAAGATIFKALEKQLGLKLEKRKEPRPVIVIDHLERIPSEN